MKTTTWSDRTREHSDVRLNGKSSQSHPAGEVKSAVDTGTILAPVRTGLARVDLKMRSLEASMFAPLANAFVDLIGSGGKRLRPAMALMVAHLDDRSNGEPVDDDRVIALAASVEMLHTSTLVHDDVIDGALLRRGAPTLNAIWNRGATVLAGDFMFARAAQFAAETNSPRVIHIFSDTLEIIVNGELQQLWSRRQFHQEESDYYRRIEAKTASLFQAAAESSGVLAGYSDDDVERLRSYGHNLGMAFQIVDDILDFTGDESSLGKPAGSDLMQGTLTLPFFHYLQTVPEPELLLDGLEAAYEEVGQAPDAWHLIATKVAADVKVSPAIEAARQEAVAFLQTAKDNLVAFPPSIYRTSLLELCDFVVQRTY